jgi:exodeoxyribonuclease VII small subunit
MSKVTPSFEKLLERIESIIARLESGKLGLDESLAEYEEGVKHLKVCLQMLDKAEHKVSLLTGVDGDGTPISQRFDEAAMTLQEKAERRSGRRSMNDLQATGQNTLFPED